MALSSHWLGDTQALHHACHDIKLFMELQPYKGQFNLVGAMKVTHFGMVALTVDGKSGKETMVQENVLLVENLGYNIYSIPQARKQK